MMMVRGKLGNVSADAVPFRLLRVAKEGQSMPIVWLYLALTLKSSTTTSPSTTKVIATAYAHTYISTPYLHD